MKTLKFNFFILFIFVSSVAFSQVNQNDKTNRNQTTQNTNNNNNNRFDEYDGNRDANIERNEFDQRFGQNYDRWDTNKDENIDQREFFEYTFMSLDRDRDRNLTQEEWEVGYDSMFGDFLGNRDYSRYDWDNNQKISQAEFDESLRNSYYYSDLDTNRDRKVDRNELNEQSYNRMDKNNDQKVDRSEYDAFDSFYSGDYIRPQN